MQRTYLKSLQEMSERLANAEKGKVEAEERSKQAEERSREAEEKSKQAEKEKQQGFSLSIKALYATGMSAELIANTLNIDIALVLRTINNE